MSPEAALIMLAGLYCLVFSLKKAPFFDSPLFSFTLFASALAIPFVVLLASGYLFLSVIYLLLMVPWKARLIKIIHHFYQEFGNKRIENGYSMLDFQPDTFRLATEWVELQLLPGERKIIGIICQGREAGRNIDTISGHELTVLLNRWQDSHPLTCSLIRLCLGTESESKSNNHERETAFPSPRGDGKEITIVNSAALPAPDIEAASTLLGVQPGAGRDAINRNFRRLMMGFHPDRGGSDALASTIYAAKNVLLDAAR